MINYFAYGSNLDFAQMKDRCPDAVIKTVAVLNDYKLDFTIYSPKRKCGCADIVASPGDQVWGLVYEVNEEGLSELDKHENHPISYRRITIEVADPSGNKIKCETYEVTQKSTEFLPPSKSYLNQILKGTEANKFPLKYITSIKNVKTLD